MEWDKHLAYEINELCRDLERLYESWPGMHGATPTPWERPEAVAYFEALLVHARNLIEFFVVGPVKHENALTPGDFGLVSHDRAAALGALPRWGSGRTSTTGTSAARGRSRHSDQGERLPQA